MGENNFNRLIETAVKKYWDKPAFTDYKKDTLTFGEVGKHILVLHEVFRKRKITPDDKIAMIGANSANWAIVYLAVITYGATVVPILPDFHDEDRQHIINHSESRVLFAADDIAAAIDEEKMEKLTTIVSLNTLELITFKDKGLPEEVRKTEKKARKHVTAADRETFSLPPDRDGDRRGEVGAGSARHRPTRVGSGLMTSGC